MTTPNSTASTSEQKLSSWDLLIAYVTGSFFFSFSGMMNFLIPLRAQELGAPLEIIGLIVGAGTLLGFVMSIPAGALADRIGARWAYILGTSFCACVALGQALSDSYWTMLVLQLARGLMGSMAWVASQTYIAHIGTEADRPTITGRFSFSTNLGSLLTPLATGAIAQVLGYQMSFWFVVAYGLLFTFLGFNLKNVRGRTDPSASQGKGMAGYDTAFQLLRLRGTQIVVLLTFVRIWIGGSWQAFFTLYLAQNGMPPALIGTVFSANAVVSTVTALAAGRMARLASKEVITAVALALGALGAVISPHTAVFPLVYLPALLMGTGGGLSLPMLLAILGESVPPNQRGVAMGLRSGVNQGANALAPMTMGFVVTGVGIPLGFAFAACVSWTLLGISMWLHALDVRSRNLSTKQGKPADAPELASKSGG